MKSPKTQKISAEAGGEIRLTASGLFFTALAPIPQGIKVRDLEPLAEGLVEEHSPLPPEQTAWGFLVDSRPKSGGHLFYYAATKELIFAKGEPGATDLSAAAVLPGFAALSGLRFSEPTWIYLLEEECLSAVLFEPECTIPTHILPRFLAEDDQNPFTARANLASRVQKEFDGNDEVKGLIRTARATTRGPGLEFDLEQQVDENAQWTSWKRSTIPKASRVRAADVRDRTFLSDSASQKATGRRMAATAIAILAAVLFLSLLEILEYRRSSETTTLRDQAEANAAAVERLKGIESMTASLRKVSQRDFRPYRWLIALNESRPPEISFTSYALDDEGRIRANGLAPDIKILNNYLALLRADPRFDSIATGSLDTDEAGVRFSLEANAGDLNATPPVTATPPEESGIPEEPSSEPTPSGEAS